MGKAINQTDTARPRFADKAAWAEHQAHEAGMAAARKRAEPNGGCWRKARQIDIAARALEADAARFRSIAAALRRKKTPAAAPFGCLPKALE